METEFIKYNKKCYEEEKKLLYQKLIGLEGNRFSLERRLKKLVSRFQNGAISNSEYKSQEKKIKHKLTSVSSKIIYLRAFITKL